MNASNNIEEVLKKNKAVQISPSGWSMYPLIVPGRDQAVIESPAGKQFKRGDVLLYRREEGVLVLHRLCKITSDGLYFVGDNQVEVEGPISKEQIIGRMTSLIRKGKQVDLTNPAFRFPCWLWLNIRPMRRVFQLAVAALKAKLKGGVKSELEGIKAVLFDLDGTLIDSMWVWKQIDIDYMAAQGKDLPDNLQEQIGGKSMRETAIFMKESFGIEQSIEEMMDTWNEMAMEAYSTRVPYKTGAEDFLKELRRRGIKTAIATSNSKELLEAIKVALHMEDYIDLFLTAGEVSHGKPAPDVYLEAARRLGVKPKKCLVFEDIVPGIMAGKNAGMRVICIEDVHSMRSISEKQAAADRYIKDFTEML